MRALRSFDRVGRILSYRSVAAIFIVFCHATTLLIGAAQSRPDIVWKIGGTQDVDVGVAAFLPDGEHFVSGGSPAKLWRINGNRLVLVRTLHPGRVSVSRNGLYWAARESVSVSENYVVVRRTLNGELVCRIQLPYSYKRTGH